RLQALRVYPPAFLRTEKGDHAADVVGHADASERGLRSQKVLHAGIVVKRAASEIGLDGARGHDVRGDTTRSQFFRQIPCKYLDGALHRGVGGISRNREPGQSGRGVYDAAAIGDAWQQLLREEVDALEVNVQ